MWSQNPNRTLEESFDTLEASDFIPTFMLLHILNTPDTVLKWMCNLRDAGLGEAAEQFVENTDDTVLLNWTSFLSRLRSYLTPFGILSYSQRMSLTMISYTTSLRCLPFWSMRTSPQGWTREKMTYHANWNEILMLTVMAGNCIGIMAGDVASEAEYSASVIILRILQSILYSSSTMAATGGSLWSKQKMTCWQKFPGHDSAYLPDGFVHGRWRYWQRPQNFIYHSCGASYKNQQAKTLWLKGACGMHVAFVLEAAQMSFARKN